jgi:hypothetical protein
MSDVTEYPYETRLNVLCQPLDVVDEKALADACRHKRYNQTLCTVNGSVVRLGVVQREYHWHKQEIPSADATSIGGKSISPGEICNSTLYSFEKPSFFSPGRNSYPKSGLNFTFTSL